jgi:IclR family pca regulon transcriptional regulator
MNDPVLAREDRGTYVQSLARGLSVIRTLDTPDPLTLSDVARRAGLSRAAARRFIHTLERLGYVRQSGGRFALTPRVLELGSAYLSSITLPEIALPHIKALVEEVRESGALSVLDGDSIVGVARVPAYRVMTGRIALGQRLPAWASASGRVLLAGLAPSRLVERLDRIELDPLTERTITDRASLEAELREVRERGFALVDQELEPGLRSLAAAVRDRDGAAIAAVALVLNSANGSIEEVEHALLPPLLRTCGEISRDLAASGARLGFTAAFETIGG